MLGILIGEKDCWSRGYGTEAVRLMCGYAFNTLGLRRVQLHVHDDNPRGVRCYEKAGLRREGVLPGGSLLGRRLARRV